MSGLPRAIITLPAYSTAEILFLWWTFLARSEARDRDMENMINEFDTIEFEFIQEGGQDRKDGKQEARHRDRSKFSNNAKKRPEAPLVSFVRGQGRNGVETRHLTDSTCNIKLLLVSIVSSSLLYSSSSS